jgi:Ca2+-binding RTX toxin-like protein
MPGTTHIITQGAGQYVISDFVGAGTVKNLDDIALIDQLQLTGPGLTAATMRIGQDGDNTVITFDGQDPLATSIVLTNVPSYLLKNDLFNNLNTAYGNFLFNDESTVSRNIDVMKPDAEWGQVKTGGGLTFMNDNGLTIIGRNNQDDIIVGGQGDDNISGLSGRDTLKGGAGNDTLDGGAGNDNLLGGGGDDIMLGGSGADTMSGGSGNDNMNGGGMRDIMNGDGGNDIMLGGDDRDTMNGGAGDDTVNGEAGDDRVSGSTGNDILLGGTGNDDLFGGADDDQLFGGDDNDRLFGGDNNDFLVGGKGNDLLDGGNGYNTANWADSETALTVQLTTVSGGGTAFNGSYTDTFSLVQYLQLSSHNDLVNGSAAVTDWKVDGGDGEDTITTGAGNDVINGDDGNDILTGGMGGDIINGGLGNDRVVDGGDGFYDAYYGNEGLNSLDYAASSSPLTVYYYPGAEGVIFNNSAIDNFYGFTGFIGGSGDDTFQAQAGTNPSTGDPIAPTENYTIEGRGGNDYIVSADGNDTLLGEDGYDTLIGGDGSDFLDTGKQGGYAAGGKGNDTLQGGDGEDNLYGNENDDILMGGKGTDYLDGGEGNDTLTDTQGSNTFLGGAGDDVITGGGGGDVIYGEADNDIINGGAGNNYISTGTGEDLVIFDSFWKNGAGVDTLADFDPLFDQIRFGSFTAPADFTAWFDTYAADTSDGVLITASEDGPGGASSALLSGLIKAQLSESNFEWV